MIWVGDIVHAAEGSAAAEAFLRRSPVRVTHLAGNHDRRWRSAGAASAVRGHYFFHHGDQTPSVPGSCIEVIGHHHPAIAWGDRAGSRFKLPALVVSGRRMILPAFSPWAAGSPWPDSGAGDETIWAIAPARIFAARRARRPVTGDAA
jgi:metallophosphoesterase superfamily enzyme